LIVLEETKKNKSGRAQFFFTDRYSVFDWGEMPDHIMHKGESLCLSTAYFFEKLEEKGIKSHYLGLVEDKKVKRLEEIKKPLQTMEIKLLRVIKPKVIKEAYDYSVYKKERENFLIPLELVYRNSLPEGSSVFRRLKEGSLQLKELGLDKMPIQNQPLKKPILDVSTKLEQKDRYLSWDEAKMIANLSEEEVEKIKQITLSVNEIITKEVRRLKLRHEDGKLEFGFDSTRSILVADTLGTLDECRFTFKNLPVSKEIARIFYRKTDWYSDVEEAKRKKGINWKLSVISNPPPLPKRLKELISMVYRAYANELTGRVWFEDTPDLKDILDEVRVFLD
ncbi:MAG: phosphoribosylaminoimidazolesuccinocarboxamide synthase, partial [Candidatus Thermoplasmatota archaeon]